MAEGKIPLGMLYREIRPTLDDLVLKDTPPLVGANIAGPLQRYASIQEAYR